ncbi:MAG TPA: hypothetical protein VGJ28_13940, partial [Micromonosporaceae bacterium]
MVSLTVLIDTPFAVIGLQSMSDDYPSSVIESTSPIWPAEPDSTPVADRPDRSLQLQMNGGFLTATYDVWFETTDPLYRPVTNGTIERNPGAFVSSVLGTVQVAQYPGERVSNDLTQLTFGSPQLLAASGDRAHLRLVSSPFETELPDVNVMIQPATALPAPRTDELIVSGRQHDVLVLKAPGAVTRTTAGVKVDRAGSTSTIQIRWTALHRASLLTGLRRLGGFVVPIDETMSDLAMLLVFVAVLGWLRRVRTAIGAGAQTLIAISRAMVGLFVAEVLIDTLWTFDDTAHDYYHSFVAWLTGLSGTAAGSVGANPSYDVVALAAAAALVTAIGRPRVIRPLGRRPENGSMKRGWHPQRSQLLLIGLAALSVLSSMSTCFEMLGGLPGDSTAAALCVVVVVGLIIACAAGVYFAGRQLLMSMLPPGRAAATAAVAAMWAVSSQIYLPYVT